MFAEIGGEAKFDWRSIQFLFFRNELPTLPDFTPSFRNELPTLQNPISIAPFSTVQRLLMVDSLTSIILTEVRTDKRQNGQRAQCASSRLSTHTVRTVVDMRRLFTVWGRGVPDSAML